jgi:hypothetical protein
MAMQIHTLISGAKQMRLLAMVVGEFEGEEEDENGGEVRLLQVGMALAASAPLSGAT